VLVRYSVALTLENVFGVRHVLATHVITFN